MRAKPKAVIFDLDGTLLDSFPMHYLAYEEMFAKFDIEMNKEVFLSTYSPNWYQTYEAFGLAEEHWESANLAWLEAANRHLPELFPGVADMLLRLDENFELGIVTSGSKSRVTSDLTRLDIAGHFTTIITGDDIQNPKPAPEGLEMALRELSISPGEAVYVGDAHADFEMAKMAGVRFYGVPSEFANLSHDHPEYGIYEITSLPEMLEMK